MIRRYARGERSFPNIDLCEADLSGVTLDGADFAPFSWFFDANFSSASLRGTSFRSCNVKCATFRDADLTGANFEDHFYAMYVLFPATVLYLAILETRRGPIARGAGWFGDATYAIYLLHFPLMLTTAILFRAAGGDFQALRSPLSLAIFLVVLIPLALASHRFFERPVQQWIRRRFSGKRPQDEAPPTFIAAVQTDTPSAH